MYWRKSELQWNCHVLTLNINSLLGNFVLPQKSFSKERAEQQDSVFNFLGTEDFNAVELICLRLKPILFLGSSQEKKSFFWRRRRDKQRNYTFCLQTMFPKQHNALWFKSNQLWHYSPPKRHYIKWFNFSILLVLCAQWAQTLTIHYLQMWGNIYLFRFSNLFVFIFRYILNNNRGKEGI